MSQQARTAQVADNDDDNSPMIYETPVDHGSWAKTQREELRKQGEEVVFMSELWTLIPRREGEADADYAKRFSSEMNAMIQRGVKILGDNITHDVAPNVFGIDGHEFDVGPNSGITKKEYREFSEWVGGELSYEDIPQRFLKYEVSRGATEDSSETEHQQEIADHGGQIEAT